MARYVLTREGEHYLKTGLPEKNLVDVLKAGPLTLKEAERRVEHFNVALLWAKKKGWVDLKFDNLVLIRPPHSVMEQDALRKVESGEELAPEILDNLLQRKLIEKVISELEEVKKMAGKEVLHLTKDLIKTGVWQQVRFKHYDVTIPGKRVHVGKTYPYKAVIDDVREKLIGLGFVEEKSPYVELNFWNADALFMPSDHPARGIHDIYSIKKPKHGKVLDKNLWNRVKATHENGWKTGSKGWGFWDAELAKTLILRSQTTALSARILSKLKKEDVPYKMFIIDKVFRPDVLDAKHLVEFDQCEGIVVDEGLSFKHLLGYMKEIAIMLGAENIKFKPSYFPFTEPSVEAYVKFPKLGWMEIGGAGIFRPEATKPLGVDVPVLAWGIGIGRLAMMKLGVSDIRYLYSDNLGWLRNKEVIR